MKQESIDYQPTMMETEVLSEQISNTLLVSSNSNSNSMKQQQEEEKKKKRRRRRSSARFLKLGENEEVEDEDSLMTTQNLSQVYQNAIKLNAENKINASNSWNLNLIDHLDRFAFSSTTRASSSLSTTMDSTTASTTNFTKASCTLDASVKIYSYRVDDVHLTSYKVLANLNRTETSSSGSTAGTNSRTESSTTTAEKMKRTPRTETDTLEQNLGMHFMNRLASFHQVTHLRYVFTYLFTKPILTSPNLMKLLILILSSTKCQKHSMKVVLRVFFWRILMSRKMDAILSLIRL